MPNTPTDVDRRRAKAQATRDQILNAAAELFLRDGYSSTSLEAVTQCSGVTKPTVYSHFHSKLGLFNAVIERTAERKAEKLDESLQVTDDLQADLIRFGTLFLTRIHSPEVRSWDRLAAAESLKHPEVGEAFFQAGPTRVLSGLSGYLQQQQERGELQFECAQRCAEQFLGMLLGLDILRTQIGRPSPSASEQRVRCHEAVDTFMAAYGVRTARGKVS